MKKFEQFKNSLDEEGQIYEVRENFIKQNYPEHVSGYEMQDLLNSGLDGMEVLEKKDDGGDIEGLISYFVGEDNEDAKYLSMGIILTREESKGEGIMRELFSELKQIAEQEDCEYITAIADTEEGAEFLLGSGFGWETDKVNGREHLRLDL